MRPQRQLAARRRRTPGRCPHIDGGDQEDLVGADPLHVQEADPLDLVPAEQGPQCAVARERSDRLTGEEVHVASDEEQRDAAEQQADADRSDRVLGGVAGQLVQPDAERRDDDADEGREVFGKHRAQHGFDPGAGISCTGRSRTQGKARGTG